MSDNFKIYAKFANKYDENEIFPTKMSLRFADDAPEGFIEFFGNVRNFEDMDYFTRGEMNAETKEGRTWEGYSYRDSKVVMKQFSEYFTIEWSEEPVDNDDLRDNLVSLMYI